MRTHFVRPHHEEEHHALVHGAQAVAEDEGEGERHGRERDDEVADVDAKDREIRKAGGDVQDAADEQLQRAQHHLRVVERDGYVAPLPAWRRASEHVPQQAARVKR